MLRDAVRHGLFPRVKRLATPLDRRLRGNAAYERFRASAIGTYRSSSWVSQADRNVYVREYFSSSVDDRLALFDSFWGRKVTGNPFAIFLQMYNDPRFADHKFIWVKNTDTEAPAWMLKDDRVRFVPHGSVAYARALLAAKYIVGNANFKEYFVRKPEQVYLNPWHGIMLKKLGRDIDQSLRNSANTQRNFNQASAIALSSTWVIDRITEAYGVLFGHKKAWAIGSPRIDLTLASDQGQVRRQLGVTDGKKVVLYAPTWRGDVRNVSTDISAQLKAIKLMQKRLSATHEIFVSLHNYVLASGVELPPGTRLVPDDMPINVLLAGVDVLVTDYSSIFFDFLVLDRPVVLFTFDLAEYANKQGLYFSLDEVPVSVVSTASELISAIKSEVQPSAFSSFAGAMEKFLPLEDGHASERAVELLTSIDGEPTRGDKVRVLLAGGTLDPGPVSDALTAFARSLDPARFEVTLVLGASAADRSTDRQIVLTRLPESCNIVARRGKAHVPDALVAAYNRWRQDVAAASDIELLKPWMALEARRVFGGAKFDVAVSFGMSSTFWVRLLSSVGASVNVAAITESVEAKRRYNNPARVEAFIRELNEYDIAMFASSALRERDAPVLRASNPRLRCEVVRPTVDTGEVFRDATKTRDVSHALLDQLERDQKQQPGITSEVIVSVGSFEPDRQHDRLIRAFATVLEQRPAALLVLIGDGPRKQPLVDLARRLRIDGSVVFAGELDNPLATVNLADCVVLGSDVYLDWVNAWRSCILGKRLVCTGLLADLNIEGAQSLGAPDSDELARAVLDCLAQPAATPEQCPLAIGEFESMIEVNDAK